MYKYILETAGDLSLLALVPLVIFFVVFVGAMLMTVFSNKKHIEHMAHLPFEDNVTSNTEIN